MRSAVLTDQLFKPLFFLSTSHVLSDSLIARGPFIWELKHLDIMDIYRYL